MSFHYEDCGEFGSKRDAEDWARRNNIDPRDLHVRDNNGSVTVGVRRSVAPEDDRYDNKHNSRREGFWT